MRNPKNRYENPLYKLNCIITHPIITIIVINILDKYFIELVILFLIKLQTPVNISDIAKNVNRLYIIFSMLKLEISSRNTTVRNFNV